MSSTIQLIFVIIACNGDKRNSDGIITLNFNDVWNDDFAVDDTQSANADDLIGSTGWSSSVILDGSHDAGDITYHGPFNDQGDTRLYRYFNIETYSRVSISLDYIWGCKPEPHTSDKTPDYGDHFYVSLGTHQSPQWSYVAPEEDATINLVYDTAITDYCTEEEGKDHAWSKTITFSAITASNSEYLVQITSHLSNVIHFVSPWEEYGLITNIQLTVSPICDLSSFNPTAEIIARYLEGVDVGDECRNSLQNQANEAIAVALEDKYAIHIINTPDTESTAEDSYFGIIPLTPQEVTASNVLDIASEDMEFIANILDAKLANILPLEDAETTEEQLDVICPQLHDIYNNIALLQRRMLMGIDPSINADAAVSIERDNFCSYTNRISADVISDGVYEIQIQDTVIQIPYDMIQTGRAEWREEGMDSVDVSVMCVDHVLMNDCNGILPNDGEAPMVDELALNIDISVDSTAANIPFTLTFPYSEENSHKVCAWMESDDQEEWKYDGCETIITDDGIICRCNHRTVFSLIEDLRLNRESVNAKSLQARDVYVGFLVVYSLLAFAATYLVITLYRIKDMKSLASVIVSVITAQIYCHVIQYIYLSFAALQTMPLGVTYCVISLPLLCHFWVCSLLILHWMKIFECAKTFTSSNKTLDIAMIAMNIAISVVFIGLLIASMAVSEDALPTIVSASNGILGSVGLSICTAWFYFGFKTSTILMKSANAVKDSCTVALTEALTLRRRLLRLTFIIGFCFFSQSTIAILSVIEHLQLFGDNFVNFATIWAICDVIIFVTFILFYRLYVLRQKHVYMMEQKVAQLEREAKRSRRDNTLTNGAHHKAKPSLAAEASLPIFRNTTPRKSVTAFKPPTMDEGRQSPVLRSTRAARLSVTSPPNSPSLSPFEVPTIANMKLRAKRSGSRASIVSNSTMATVTTLKSAHSLDSHFNTRLRRARSQDDSYVQRRSLNRLKRPSKDLLDLDYNDRQRSHSASSSRQKSTTPSLSKQTSVTPKKKSPSSKKKGDALQTKKKRVESDSLAMVKTKRKGNKGKKGKRDKTKGGHLKRKVASDSLVRTKKKKKNKVVKSAAMPKVNKAKKKKPVKTAPSKTPKAKAKARGKSSEKTVGKKSKTTRKVGASQLKPKASYDGNEMDEEIEKTLHEVHKRSSSSSVASLKGFKDITGLILKSKTGQSASTKSMSKKRKKPGKSKSKSKSKSNSEFKPKQKIKASRTKTAKTQTKNSRNIMSAKRIKSEKKKAKADK